VMADLFDLSRERQAAKPVAAYSLVEVFKAGGAA
jgi:hypothetical protein